MDLTHTKSTVISFLNTSSKLTHGEVRPINSCDVKVVIMAIPSMAHTHSHGHSHAPASALATADYNDEK